MKWRRSTTSSSVSSLAAASLLRGLPSSRASSPNISPGLMTFSVTSLPSPETELMRTRPRSTAIIEEPLSPRWKMVWPRRTRRSEANFRISSSSSDRMAANSELPNRAARFTSRSSLATSVSRSQCPARRLIPRWAIPGDSMRALASMWYPGRPCGKETPCRAWMRQSATPWRTRRHGREICGRISRPASSSRRRTTRSSGPSVRAARRTG